MTARKVIIANVCALSLAAYAVLGFALYHSLRVERTAESVCFPESIQTPSRARSDICASADPATRVKGRP